jgi:two-component system chemotaxis response regulator CheB
MASEPKYIVVVGTSAGGIRAIEELVLQLTPEMDAAFFVVLHLSRKGIGDLLFHRLQQLSPLPCRVAVNDEKIHKGVIYLAPPDEHMILDKDRVVLGKGAQENRWRPSINNLFRSAAAHYSSRVIGIILTGLLDDGTVGMAAVKRAGGFTICQDPNEADYPDMPLSVLENVEVDHVASLSTMGAVLSDVIANREPEPHEVPPDIMAESEMDLRVSTRIDDFKNFDKVNISCPDCGGALWVTQSNHPTHYRCHVGHSFTDRELLIRISETMETTFWTSLRMMEERRTLLLKLHKKDKDRGYESIASQHLKRAEEMEAHIDNLKKILFTVTQVD